MTWSWSSFLGGIASSLIIGGIVKLLFKLTPRFIKLIYSLFLKLLKVDYEKVYISENDAKRDIKRDFDRSSRVRIFCTRGRSFIQPDGSMSFILNEIKNRPIRFLLADPNSATILNREIELKSTSYVAHVKSNYEYFVLEHLNKPKNIECRLHDEPVVFRIMFFDDIVYFGFYQQHEAGADSMRIYRTKRGSEIYNGIERYYETVWSKSKMLKQDIDKKSA